MFSKRSSRFDASAEITKRLVSGILLLGFITSSFAFGGETAPKDSKKNNTGHPHCGLYCLYSIMKIEGQEIDFKNLVKPEYLGSRKGSSLAELEQAAKDFGLNAVPIARLTPEDLKSITYPTILHVKSGYEQKDYDHFVLYMGNKNGKALIFDAPSEPALVEYGSLAPRWDGNALMISSEPLVTSKIAATSRKRLALYAGLAVLGIFAIHFLKRLVPENLSLRLRLGLSIGQIAGFALIAVFAGLLCHYFDDGCFFANAPAVKGVQKVHAGNFVHKLTPGKMQKVFERGDAVVLDARLKRDYEAGHIDGAISVPINSSDEHYSQVTSALPKDGRIVLYCQSAGCKYAEKIAIRLKEDGFKNLSVFKAGWVEWQKTNEVQSTKAEGEKNEKEIAS